MSKAPTRSEIFEADLYRSDKYRWKHTPRKRDLALLTKVHVEKFNSENVRPDFGEDAHTVQIKPEDLEMPQMWICDSNVNPAVYCVYNIAADPACDSCLYCGQPYERK